MSSSGVSSEILGRETSGHSGCRHSRERTVLATPTRKALDSVAAASTQDQTRQRVMRSIPLLIGWPMRQPASWKTIQTPNLRSTEKNGVGRQCAISSVGRSDFSLTSSQA